MDTLEVVWWHIIYSGKVTAHFWSRVMKLGKFAFAVVVVSMLGGCMTSPPVPRVPLNDSEYQRLPQVGTGVIEGQAFLKTLGGEVKYGAGSTVYLFPVTSYSEQWWRLTQIEMKPIAAPDPKHDKYIRTTQADGTGTFKFTDIPPGPYFIDAEVTWFAPTGYGGGLEKQGGVIAHRIKVDNDKTTRIMITQ
ncbi:MAG: hypothetical protein ABWY17_01225 [Pseudomonas sp.]|uniref:hypothetical protein n=1 Tax=Pseudomonas sp. CFII64 TaxID=911242 RepID=UPI0012EBDA93|nr:hypothetical protein [Pseudomonas sp. CFII64]